jgi:hypothetical protein
MRKFCVFLAGFLLATTALGHSIQLVTVAKLPVCSAQSVPFLIGVSDPVDAKDCSVGLGAAVAHLCFCDPSVPVYLGVAEVTIDHGGLGGLGDDDHAHYVLNTGDTMTGNLTVVGTVIATIFDPSDVATSRTNFDVYSKSETDTEIDTDIATHTAIPTAHHTATVDTNAKTFCADNLALLGNASTTCVDTAPSSEIDTDIATHAAISTAHHTATVDTNAKTLCGDGLALLGDASTTCVAAGATDHGALTGLGDDDHTQYVLNTGDTMTGDLTIDSDKKLIFDGTAGGAGGGVEYFDASNNPRYVIHFPGSDVVAISNRASNGVVQIRANTATAGAGGEVTAVVVEDNEVQLLPSGGNVGIGTATPGEQLQVEGVTGIYVEVSATGANSQAGFSLKNDAREYRLQVRDDDQFYIRDATGTTDRLTIDTTGEVGINDITPSFRLDVNGTFRATGNGFFDSDLDVTGDLIIGAELKMTVLTVLPTCDATTDDHMVMEDVTGSGRQMCICENTVGWHCADFTAP